MRNIFYRMFFKSDFFTFLTADINTEMGVKDVSRDEIYPILERSFELVGIRRQNNLFKRFLSTRKLSTLVYEQRIKFNRHNSL